MTGTESPWRPDGTGVQGAGDRGGDIQAGDSYSVRFVRDDKPCLVIDVTYYPVEYEQCPGEFVVQRQVEWLECDDPGWRQAGRSPWDTEVWSDVNYDDVTYTVMGTAGEAERQARKMAQEDASASGAEMYGTWDGERYGE